MSRRHRPTVGTGTDALARAVFTLLLAGYGALTLYALLSTP